MAPSQPRRPGPVTRSMTKGTVPGKEGSTARPKPVTQNISEKSPLQDEVSSLAYILLLP